MSQQTYAEQIRERGKALRAAGETERAGLVFRAVNKLEEAQELEQEAHAQKKDREARGGGFSFASLFRIFQLSAEAKFAMAKNIRNEAEKLLEEAGI